MAASLRQENYNKNLGAGVITLTTVLASNPIVGNLVSVGGFGYNSGGAAPTITIKDGNLNTYTNSPHSPSSADTAGAGHCYSAYFIASGTPDKNITVTFGSGVDDPSLWVMEFAKGATETWSFGNDAAGTGASGTTINTPTIPNSTGDLLVAYGAPDHVVNGVGGAWTAQETLPVASGDGAAYILSASGANVAVNFSMNTSGGWDSMGMNFVLSAAPSAPVAHLLEARQAMNRAGMI